MLIKEERKDEERCRLTRHFWQDEYHSLLPTVPLSLDYAREYLETASQVAVSRLPRTAEIY